MRKLTLLVVICALPWNSATAQFFWGFSGNLDGGANAFVGIAKTNISGSITYYGKDIVSIDVTFKKLDLSVSYGDNLLPKRENFIALSLVPVIPIDKFIKNWRWKWKPYFKFAMFYNNTRTKINRDKFSTAFGIGWVR